MAEGSPTEALGDLSQGQLAQHRELVGLEEVLKRTPHFFLGVDLPCAQALQQILHGQIEVHDLVCLLEEGVRHRLSDLHVGRLFDQILETLEVLDVEGADDADARVEQVAGILVAFGVPGSRNIRVGDFVHDRDLRMTGEDGIQIHLFDLEAPVLEDPTRHHLEALK